MFIMTGTIAVQNESIHPVVSEHETLITCDEPRCASSLQQVCFVLSERESRVFRLACADTLKTNDINEYAAF